MGVRLLKVMLPEATELIVIGLMIFRYSSGPRSDGVTCSDDIFRSLACTSSYEPSHC
jgi:hypothetical protein